MKKESPFETFEVNQPGDWKKVAEHLMSKALDQSDEALGPPEYSRTEEEARARWSSPTPEELEQTGRHTVLVLLNGRHPVSVVLSGEPEGIHLSMVGHNPRTGGYVRVSDHTARAAAEAILGHYKEFSEGAIREVRHFRQAYQ